MILGWMNLTPSIDGACECNWLNSVISGKQMIQWKLGEMKIPKLNGKQNKVVKNIC